MPRRDRTDPLQDAKAAINNSPQMAPDARYDLLSSSLVLVTSDNDRLELVGECIFQGWLGGLNMLISGLSIQVLETRAFLDYVIVQSHLSQDTQLEMVRSLVNKGCRAVRRKQSSTDDTSKFIVFKKNYCDEMIYNPSVLDTAVWNCVYLAQVVVQENKPTILSFILPKLDSINLRIALIESMGGDVKDCCDVLVDFLASSHPQLDFAILLAAIYGRSDFLDKLLNKAPANLIDTLRSKKFDRLDQFSPIHPSAPKSQTIIDATIYFNHPVCLDLVKRRFPNYPYNMTPLLQHCAENNFTECLSMILTFWTFHSKEENSDSHLVEILYTALRCRCSPPLITDLIDRMKNTTGCKRCLENVLLKCVEKKWHEALLILVSRGSGFLGNSDEVKVNAEKTLNRIVFVGVGQSTNEIVKNLVASFGAVIDLRTSFKRLLLVSKNKELVDFYLSLGNRALHDLAKKLRPSVTDTALKKVIDAKNNFNVKLEVVKEEDEEEEEEPVVLQVVAPKKVAKKAVPKKAGKKK